MLYYMLAAIEATDWQLLAEDGKSWGPWTLEAMSLGYWLLGRIDTASHARVLDVITEEVILKDQKADAFLREMGLLYLLHLPGKDRALAVRWVQRRARRTKSSIPQAWARRAYESLTIGRLAG